MADWIGINSSHLDSFCGQSDGRDLDEALDATGPWYHLVDEIHWFILDLGATYTITKVRGWSDSTQDPIDIDIFVSNSKTSWGDAVATEITTWQDTDEWVEINTTEKNGQYIKIVINDTEWNDITWGKFNPPQSIFDAYGEILGEILVDNAIFFGCNF